MQTIAILGRQPEFGLVELESLLDADGIQPWGRYGALLDSEPDINHLGGTQKLGRILYQGPTRDLGELPLDLAALPLREGKTNFGLSYYGLKATPRFVLQTGLTLKKRLRNRGSLRLVTPQAGTSLSAAQVKFNGLIHKGFELLIVINKQQMVVALTTQLQDIDGYAARDYGRPSRSAKVGMLPPKLTQIMINTTTAPLVYDPFCGTGVVLQEALLLGRQANGSDSSEAMVAATQENLDWLHGLRPELPRGTATRADAREVKLPTEPLAIVSEGYLGPNLNSIPKADQLKELQVELSTLYTEALCHWHGQLPPGAEIAITAPVWRVHGGREDTGIIDRLPDLGYTLSSFAHCNSRDLVYRRPDQTVGRQLLILRKP
jgi:tRNA G10  N-methylase Trm11